MRTVWDEGATADLRITVDGAGPSTDVTLAMTAPDGTETDPAATPNVDRTEWTATPALDAPGIWWVVATVTGDGAGVKRYRLRVRPAGPVTDLGRVYATTGDLARHMSDAPPVDADRLLRRASEIVEGLTVTAIYDTDPDGYPTDAKMAATLREATCAQASFMAAGRGSEFGTAAEYGQVSIGSVSLSGRGQATTGPTTADGIPVAPGCVAALRRHPGSASWALVVG